MIRRPPRSTLFPYTTPLPIWFCRHTAPSQGLSRAHSHHVCPTSGTARACPDLRPPADRKSTRLNSSHANISYAVFCLKKKKTKLVVQLLLFLGLSVLVVALAP